MAFYDKEELVIAVYKSAGETVQVKRCEIEGRKFVDLRTYAEDKEGVHRATSRGVVVPEEGWTEILKAFSLS